MFKKKNEIDTGGLNEIIYLSKNILKLLFIILIIGIVLGPTIKKIKRKIKKYTK